MVVPHVFLGHLETFFVRIAPAHVAAGFEVHLIDMRGALTAVEQTVV